MASRGAEIAMGAVGFVGGVYLLVDGFVHHDAVNDSRDNVNGSRIKIAPGVSVVVDDPVSEGAGKALQYATDFGRGFADNFNLRDEPRTQVDSEIQTFANEILFGAGFVIVASRKLKK